MDRRKIAELGDRAQKLAELKQHPSWKTLTEIFDHKRDVYYQSLTKRLMAKGNLPEDFEYKRGFFAGAAYILAHPENAESAFNSAVDKAERLKEDE